MRTYIVDTSVLMDDPKFYESLGVARIIIPQVVINQLDGLKMGELTAPRANKAIHELDLVRRVSRPQGEWRVLPSGASFRISDRFDQVRVLENAADNKIVGTAYLLKRMARADEETILLTRDTNMRVAAVNVAAYGYPLSYYEVLGVSESATIQEIRNAYHEKIKQCHPDRHQAEPEQIKTTYMDMAIRINLAHEILSDPVQRKDYDGMSWRLRDEFAAFAASNEGKSTYPGFNPPPPTEPPFTRTYYKGRQKWTAWDWALLIAVIMLLLGS